MGGVLSGNTLNVTLYRGTGPVPGANCNSGLVKQTAVGTATLTFNFNTSLICSLVGLSFQIMDKCVVAQNPVNRWIMNRYEIKSSADADADVKGYVNDVRSADE